MMKLLSRSFPLLLLIASGCASSRSTFTLSQVGGNDVFEKTFPQAYASRTPDGDYQILLIDDPTPPAQPAAGQPLKAVTQPPLRQIVHIRTLWRPSRGTKPDHPSATNGSIDWFVFGTGTLGQEDRVHYEGVGFVTIDADEESVKVEVRNATLKTASRSGAIADPLGKSRLTGTITASRDDRRVRELLAEVRSATAVARTAAARESVRPGS